eukprot:4679818-Lingulodinium_polyedra.AAC.1
MALAGHRGARPAHGWAANRAQLAAAAPHAKHTAHLKRSCTMRPPRPSNKDGNGRAAAIAGRGRR